MGETAPIVESEESVPMIEKEESVPIIEKGDSAPISEKEENAAIAEKGENATIAEKGESVPMINREESVPMIDNEESVPIIEKVNSAPISEKEENATIAEKEENTTIAEKEHNEPIIEAAPPPKQLTIQEIYALIHGAISGSVPKDTLITTLKETQSRVSDKAEFADHLADLLFQCDIETSFMSKDVRGALLDILKTIIKSDIVPVPVALERLEIDTNDQIGILPDKKSFNLSYNRLRTRTFYKQRKYNLFREENEGFARVIAELSQLNSSNAEETLVIVTEIIGKYRIDPNRVLDLVLEVFEYNSVADYDIYIRFLKALYNMSPKITQLIILKLDFYANFKNEHIICPQSLYRLIAVLVHHGIVEFDEIYPYLVPSDEKILDYHKQLVDEGKAIAKKYAMAVVGDEKPTKTVLECLSDEDRYTLEIDNQKINLCASLIHIGDWENALLIARRLPEFYCFSNHKVASSACDLISYLIHPIYREYGLPRPLNSRIKQIAVRKHLPEQITTVLDFQTKIFPMLSSLGPFLGVDTLLLTKVIRLLRQILLTKNGDQNLIESEDPLYYQILDIIDESILPAISLSGSNSCLARELWGLIRNFKYHIRYKLYYNWRDEGSNPVMLRNRGQTLLKAKHHMKRLSKETLRFTGRHIGKLCYSNPVITLNYILIQIQSYDNLINLVVDALRFLPPIAMDSLIYCIIEALSDPHKNKKSFDGMALAQWLTSLSLFSANIILRYKVDFIGFLEYVASQLKAGNSLDLVLLTDLIQKMTGIETLQAITDDRLEALMGGDVLRTEGGYFNQVKNTRKPSARLKDALIESRLAMPLCIHMAQLRDSLFFGQNDETTPLKLVGKLYDQCQETLVQYGVFLSMNLNINDYINFLPPLDKLITEHKLYPETAFFLARPMIFHKIKSKFVELTETAAKELSVEEGESPELSPQSKCIKFVEAARSVIDPLTEAIAPSLLEKYGTNNLKPKLFVIFWTLSMSDIEVPVSCYEREIQRLKSTLAELSKFPDDDPKRRKEKERCNILVQRLKQEQADQVEHTAYIKMYLESEKNNLFFERVNKDYDSVYLECRQFVQHCPFARSILTAHDAVYSARFIIYLHELKVEDYSTIICLDRLLCDLTYMMGACTENEANHYGRFLASILKTTSHWHSDSVIYNEECEVYPGSIIKIENSDHISYDNYRDICYKWHYRLTRAFTIALESNNYVQIRNALIVMISIIDYYPAIKHFGKGIGMKIDDVRNNEKESRQDLYALATAYAGRLDEKRPNLIPESKFHTVEVKAPSKSKPPSPPPAREPSKVHRERHSSSSSRKKARHD